MDQNKIKTKEVGSANIWYLICGILITVLLIVLEIAGIHEIITLENKPETFILFIILQLPVLICFPFSTLIGDYIHRTKFNLYYCKLENGIDIEYIRKNYYIASINKNFVLFVDKENEHNFCVWELMQGYDSLYQAEIALFSDEEGKV